MVVSINQPAYIPWLGYFERIARSDIHIVLDHVQFEKNSFINRNKIRIKEGTSWLTIPLATKGKFGNLAISSLEFPEGSQWLRKHWASLKLNYGTAQSFSCYAAPYEALYAREWKSFLPFVREMLKQHLVDLGISTPLMFSSDMGIVGQKSELVLNLCRAVGATNYISGAQGKNYIDETAFKKSGISIQYQTYQHPTYKQQWPGFESHLGILDLLFNEGPASLKLLLLNQTPRINENISHCRSSRR